MRQTIDKLAAKLVTLFTAAALFVALLLGGAGVPAQAATPANDGKFYSDFLSYEESLAAGRDANAEIASEGITLLKNENGVLPLKDVKYVSVFGKNGVDPYYHGFGAGAAQSTLDPVTLYDGLEMAGYKTNSVLKAFYENDARSGSDRTIGELIGEAPVEKYDAAVKRSFELYDDAAIVCISRAVNEGKDAVRTYAHDQAEDPESEIERDRHYLELSKNEQDMIEYIKELGFEKIIVLINSANAFEVAPLMADNEIDGLLWISSPGYDGFRALGEILNGEVNPSGHLVDTWYSDFTKDPTWFNFGDNSQTSADGKTPNYQFRDAETGEPLEGVQFKEFVQYEEGIYVDYRYYETVYADMVTSDGKAAADAWYEENVVFPFGYGMSYTDFAVTEVTASLAAGSDLRDVSTGKITFEVTGETDCKMYNNKASMSYPDLTAEALAFSKAAANGDFVFIAKAAGRYHIIGSPDYRAVLNPSGDSGDAAGSAKGISFEVECPDVTPLPIYEGTIKLADGELDCATGAFTPKTE